MRYLYILGVLLSLCSCGAEYSTTYYPNIESEDIPFNKELCTYTEWSTNGFEGVPTVLNSTMDMNSSMPGLQIDLCVRYYRNLILRPLIRVHGLDYNTTFYRSFYCAENISVMGNSVMVQVQAPGVCPLSMGFIAAVD